MEEYTTLKSLNSYSVQQLRHIVSEYEKHYKINGYEKMKKSELIKQIKIHQEKEPFFVPVQLCDKHVKQLK